MGLTNKQRIFINEYLKVFNATEAARRAGYSEKYLNTNACKLLHNTTISGEIKKRLRESAMTADEVLVRLAEQARGEYSAYLKEDGSCDIAKMIDDGKAHLIKGIKHDKNGNLIQVEFYDAHAALVDIGRYWALFTDKTESSVTVNGSLVILPPQANE